MLLSQQMKLLFSRVIETYVGFDHDNKHWICDQVGKLHGLDGATVYMLIKYYYLGERRNDCPYRTVVLQSHVNCQESVNEPRTVKDFYNNKIVIPAHIPSY